MPTYQYACTNDDCGLRFERVQAFTDDPISSCPDCTHRVRKVYGSVGVVFKGSGFYRNDSRAKADSAAPSGSSSSDTSSDSSAKPAAASNGSSGSTSDKPASSGTNGAAATKSSDRKATAPVAG